MSHKVAVRGALRKPSSQCIYYDVCGVNVQTESKFLQIISISMTCSVWFNPLIANVILNAIMTLMCIDVMNF